MAASPKSKDSIAYLGPATAGTAVTPHDSNLIPVTKALICGANGTVAVRFVDSAADVSLTLTAGVVYDISVIAVRATGTTATGIVALY